MSSSSKKGAPISLKKQTLSPQEVLHVASLANLKLSEKEVSLFQNQLSEVLDYVGQLQSVDTAGVPETSQVTGLESITREDKVELTSCLTQGEAVANAPKSENGYIKVKAIMKAK